MSTKATPFAYVLGGRLLVAAMPAFAQDSTSGATTSGTSTKASGKTPKGKKAAADKAAADKAAADKAAADKAAADKAAADQAAADKAAADKAADDKAAADKAAADKAAADKAAADKAAAEANDPFEDPNKTYRFIGLRYRDAVVPKFMINWFASGGRNVNVPMVGPVYTTRKDHVEYDLSLMYADYSMDPFLFKGLSDPVGSYELVESQLKLFYFMMDILYEIPLETKENKTGRFALLLGGGVGLAIVAGDLYRSQAYPLNGNANARSEQPKPVGCMHAGGAGGHKRRGLLRFE